MSQNTTIRAAAVHAEANNVPTAELPTRTQKLIKPRARSEQNTAAIATNAVPQPAVKAPKAARVIEDNTNGVQPMPKLPRSVRKPKAPKICECGCGGSTKGGRFVPGHDARLHGWVLRVSRGHVKLEDIKHEGERAAVKAHLAGGGK